MEHSFVMDNDSGYVSHNQESNLEAPSENMCSTRAFPCDLYLSEDALLEKPILKSEETDKHSESFDSVISASLDSVQTEFSGFEDSDSSVLIPRVQQIVYDGSAGKENKTFSTLNVPEEPSRPHKVLANVTNTYNNQCVPKNGSSDKENIPQTPQKRYRNLITSDVSPDLFGEEEEETSFTVPMKKESPKNLCSKDTKLLKNVQASLNGVHPPPSVTMINMTVAEMLEKINENRNLFWTASSTVTATSKSLLVSDTKECLSSSWPGILEARYHGLHYNRGKVCEDVEHLCLKVAERYVGAETASSCRAFEANPSSSQKWKLAKSKWTVKSPGRRLSHLARRRITFSSANLQASSSSAILGSRTRQILVDARKLTQTRKSPRKTPSKSPFKIRKNTPSSSAKKKLAMRFREMSGEFDSIPSTSSASRLNFDSGRSMEKKSTKRALFLSPLKHSPKKSPLKMFTLDKKRKRTDSDCSNPSKFPRSFSLDTGTSKPESNILLSRTVSETFTRSEEMSDQHKKKLQWAVYESLRLQNVAPGHPQYKAFASVLARVTRKFLPSLRFEGRTTEKMFRIARHHSYAVVKGKTMDEIVNEYQRNRMKQQRPQGYVGIEEFNRKKSVDKENVQEKSGDPGSKPRSVSQSRVDKIRKVISFEEKDM